MTQSPPTEPVLTYCRRCGYALVGLAGKFSPQDLDLARTGVTDRGVAQLANLPALRWLDLTCTAVTDASLAPLQTIARLSQVVLTDTRVSREAIGRFERALPRTAIIGP